VVRSKLMILIACGSAVSAGLLVVRQQRLQAVYEMSRSLERAAEHDRTIWRVRAEIATSVTPERVRVMAEKLGPMAPIPRELCPPAVAQGPGWRGP